MSGMRGFGVFPEAVMTTKISIQCNGLSICCFDNSAICLRKVVLQFCMYEYDSLNKEKVPSVFRSWLRSKILHHRLRYQQISSILLLFFRPSAVYMHKWTGLALVQVMACRLFITWINSALLPNGSLWTNYCEIWGDELNRTQCNLTITIQI